MFKLDRVSAVVEPDLDFLAVLLRRELCRDDIRHDVGSVRLGWMCCDCGFDCKGERCNTPMATVQLHCAGDEVQASIRGKGGVGSDHDDAVSGAYFGRVFGSLADEFVG